MNWNDLLQPIRLHKESVNRDKYDIRTEFLRDIDKITFSPYFRALQDKTQVYPLSTSSYIRTRLTHSIEVGTVGRSLGHLVGKHIINKHNLQNNTRYDFGYIIQAAALAHDIGNPPFGHSGEEAICNFYEHFIQQRLTNLPKKDKFKLNENTFTKFDGNAQGFRIITKLAKKNDQDQFVGLNLTLPVIATFCKYPNVQIDTNYIGSKKIGVFHSEKNILDKVQEKLKIKNYQLTQFKFRHPLTYLLEAADDICYLTADLCDSLYNNIVDLNTIHNILSPLLFSQEVKNFINNTDYMDIKYFDCLKDQLDTFMNQYNKIDHSFSNDQITLIAEILAKEIINILTLITIDTFLKMEEDILSGEFHSTLLSKSSITTYIDDIRKLTNNKIYSSVYKNTKEIKGITAINAILNEFTNIVINIYNNQLTQKDKLLNQTYLQNAITADKTLQENLQIINDYIIKLTDKQVLEVYYNTSTASGT